MTRPITTLLLVAVCLALLTVTVVSVAVPITRYLEAREAQERKETAEQMIEAIDSAAEKIPDFKLLSRERRNVEAAGHDGRRFGRLGR